MSFENKINCIRDNLSDVDMILQLAEEASELSQAASKALRVKLGHNPTPVTEEQALKSVLEEYADVLLSFKALFNGQHDKDVLSIKHSKLDRWYHRVCEHDAAGTIKVDGLPCRKGDVYTGLSDGKKWVLLETVPCNYPHTLEVCLQSDSSVVKEVKPEWMCRYTRCIDKHGHRVKPGDYVYKDSIIPYTVTSLESDNIAKLKWPFAPSMTYLFNTETVTHVFKDSTEFITNDMQNFESNPDLYARHAKINTRYSTVNDACMRHFAFRCSSLQNHNK